MTTEPVVVGWAQNKFVKDSTVKPLSLFLPNGFLNDNNYESYHTPESDTNYLIPVGKKYIILQVCMVSASSVTAQGDIYLGYSTTVDSATGFNLIGRYTQTCAVGAPAITFEPYIEVPAGNYITGRGNANSYNVMLNGVEVDA